MLLITVVNIFAIKSCSSTYTTKFKLCLHENYIRKINKPEYNVCILMYDKIGSRHFGHGHFGHGRFGQEISATDISTSDISTNGHFGHGHFGHGKNENMFFLLLLMKFNR